MTLLLDSHVALWWESGDGTLSAAARKAIEDPTRAAWCSAASVWELAINVRSGKLILDVSGLINGLDTNGIGIASVDGLDAVAGGSLGWSHNDPFDRMIVAQALRRGWTIVTRDRAILDFVGVDRSIPA